MSIIKYVEKIQGHPVVAVLSRMMVEVGEYGAYDIALHWQQSAFYIEEGGAIVAALSYETRVDRSAYFINAAYVMPRFRQQGLYKKLFEALMSRAHSKGIQEVYGTVAWHNTPMRKAAMSVGRIPQAITYSIEVRGEDK